MIDTQLDFVSANSIKLKSKSVNKFSLFEHFVVLKNLNKNLGKVKLRFNRLTSQNCKSIKRVHISKL